jgi:hypothetical protein
MTPKEKAKELVNKIKNGLWKDRGVSIYSEDAIYCALIAVDEILKVLCTPHKNESEYMYWQEVKQEINLL